MPFPGVIVFGEKYVKINDSNAARRSDLTSHGACIGEGEPTVVIGGFAAARKFDRFKCPDTNPVAHVGGAIVEGSSNVIIGGQPAARMDDDTHCHGEGFFVEDLDASPGGAGQLDAATAAECKALWDKYQREAADLLKPAGDDHRKRNHIINGAYASLFRRNPKFVWAGLGAYASKQVGCAMDHSLGVMNSDYMTPPQKDLAKYTYDRLGEGNRALFLDVYPQHRFYEEQGFEKFKQCAGEKVPPVGGAMLDAFEALDRYDKTGDKKYLHDHLEAVAYHEQVFILQRGIYNDRAMRFILDANEGNMKDALENPVVPVPNLPKSWREKVDAVSGAKPADVVMTSECSDTSPGKKKTIPFNPGDPNRNLYDTDDRMNWILKDIGGYYEPHAGSQEHNDDLDRLMDRGRDQGASYP